MLTTETVPADQHRAERSEHVKESVRHAMSVLQVSDEVIGPVYTGLTFGSIGLSLLLYFTGRKDDALFVGLWPPTFLALGILHKMLKDSQQEPPEPT